MSKLYAIHKRDAAGAPAIRMEKLADHLAHFETVLDRVLIAGPLRDEAGQFTGSLLVIRAEDPEDARAFVERDPYFKAGVWDDIRIDTFDAVAGDWVGGKTW